MGRGLPTPEASLEPEKASGVRAKTIADWAEPCERKKRVPDVARKTRERYAQEADRMRREADWGEAEHGHLVALYIACHEHCYGSRPTELDQGKEFAQARFAVGRLAKKEFEGNRQEVVSFVRWTWTREESREKWRRKEGRPGGRISWRVQFSSSLVSDYRIDKSRRNA